MLPQSGCIDVSATVRKRSWNASVWHWPREAGQTVCLSDSSVAERCGADAREREPLLTVVGRARGAT